MGWYTCTTKQCQKSPLKYSWDDDKVKSGKAKCPVCKKTGNWEAVEAPQEENLDHLDLQKRTVSQMLNIFVIDEHQSKHYSEGLSKYGLFDMEWDDVHRLILACVQQLLTLQKKNGLSTPTDGFVIIEDVKKDRWSAGTGKGYTNVIKIQMGTASKEFSGHGYPADKAGFEKGGSQDNTVTAKVSDAAKVVLSSTNNTARKAK